MVFILRMRTQYTKTYDICHWKDETGVFQFVLNASPLNPRCHLNNNMSLYTYTAYVKGVSGLGGGGGGVQAKEDIN